MHACKGALYSAFFAVQRFYVDDRSVVYYFFGMDGWMEIISRDGFLLTLNFFIPLVASVTLCLNLSRSPASFRTLQLERGLSIVPSLV